MKTKRIWTAAITALSFGVVLALPQEKQEKKAVPAGAPIDPALEAKMKEFGTPGPAHRVLDAKVGNWTGEMKTWMGPDTEPQVSTAKSEVEWILDGHYLEETFTCDVLGQPFTGKSLMGYDNMKKEYFFTFLDNMGTGMAIGEGKYDPAAKTFTYTMEMPCPQAGQYIKGRIVEKAIDADHLTWQMYSTTPEGKEFLGMEIKYARAK
jgi:hypothetical protein